MSKPFCVYVDVDETFVRNYGASRVPIPSVIEHIRQLKDSGAELYCWSSGGAEYAQSSAEEFGIDDCFRGFLPKPKVVIDDQNFSSWRNLLQVHPNECPGNTIDSYANKIIEKRS